MTEHAPHETTTENEHGSISSYVIGFILSLALTVIPYLMVTRGIMSGTTLLLIILGLAVVQMFVQVFFFLHLGRGPKPLYNIVFFVMTGAFITIVVGASLLIMDNLYRNMSPAEVTTRMAQEENIAEINGIPTGACQGNNANHEMFVSGTVSPQLIEANRCDTLTLKSSDGKSHEFVFGTEESPLSYGGQYEIAMRSDRAKIITLNEVGSFTFYATDDPTITGTFTVKL